MASRPSYSGHARHEGPRVRVPARSPARARASRRCSSTPASWGRRSVRAGHRPRGGRRGRRRRRRGAARRRRPRRRPCRRWRAARPRSSRASRRGALDGVLGLGGSGGISIAATAMQALPVGVPKLMVSTIASGDTRPIRRRRDMTMMYSVVDVAGINSISARILANAAAAIAGMAGAHGARAREQPGRSSRPRCSASRPRA